MMRPIRTFFVLLAAAISGFGAVTAAEAASEPEQFVEKARFTLEEMLADPSYGQLAKHLKVAKGVLIVPSQLKAAFFVGAEGGSGVLLARHAPGDWSYPAFYTVGTGSIGLQFGFQDAQVVLVIMTDRGLKAVIDDQLKLGVDASVAAGPVGTGLEGATTTGFGPDIVAFSKVRGLFGGGSFEGAVIFKRQDWNTEFYGAGATPRRILLDRMFGNPLADRLRAVLSQF